MRYPAALNGLTALKPTWGRLPVDGIHPLAPDLDTVGPMCRNAEDLREVFAVLDGRRTPRVLDRGGPAQDLTGLRFGVDAEYLSAGVDPEVVQALRGVLDRLEALGVEVVEVHLPPVTEPLEAQIALMAHQCAFNHLSRYRAAPDAFGQLADVIEDGIRRPADTPARAATARARFNAGMDQVFASVDAVVTPVLPFTAISYADYDAVMSANPDIGRFTAPYNLGRQPAIVFPAGVASTGMPIGVQLVGPHGADEALMDWVALYQQSYPTEGSIPWPR